MSASRLLQGLADVVEKHGERVCALDADNTLTFSELSRSSRRLAHALSEGFGDASRVALLAPASVCWVQGFAGVIRAGRLLVPLVEIHPEREHARALESANVDLLLVASELLARAEGAVAAMAPGRTRPSIEVLEPLLEREVPAAWQPPAVVGSAPGVLFFTSGTTGRPKGALVSHDQWAALAELVGTHWEISARDRLLHCLPLHHTHGLSIAFLVGLLAGASVRFLRRFVAADVWAAFGESTVFMGVPTMHKRLLDAFDEQPKSTQDLWREAARRQRLITSGSAALSEGVAERWRALTGRIPLERFGMTEVGVALSNPLHGERCLGSCGQVLPGMQVRIVDDQGGDTEPGQSGEIWIRGPSVFSGYDGDSEATAQAFHDGWFKSGDTATWLSDGFVKILGRTSVDIIKSGGYKLSALEIEEALRRHPDVDDAAVVGVPDPDWGEMVVAAVVGRELADTETLRDFLKAELAPYKVPRRIVRVAELPRNALGKVTKHVLKQQF